MSLTATLLLGDQITLPKGRRRRHRMDGIGATTTNRSHIAQANERALNIERVYAAIVSGARTRTEIIDATGLSNATVWKATCELEIWPSGPRIVIRKEPGKHLIYAV
jgi:hypothetical protein